MNDKLKRFIKNVADSRQLVINSGGRPDTLKISKQAIEDIKIFGMNIEVVESSWLPDGVKFMVFEEGAIYPQKTGENMNEQQLHLNDMSESELRLKREKRKYIQELIDYRTKLLVDLSEMELEVHRINELMEYLGYE